MPTGKRRDPIAQASMAAARLHARLHTDLSRPVDIFKIVQELGIWLSSRPLGNLFGFYLRQDEILGICLNAGHPESLQRYTCAHELGHHLLGHDSNLDDAADIDNVSGSSSIQERAAQVFAGNFLMPLGLVNRVLRRLDLYDQELSASDVYQVSRELDVSYTAAIWRLRTLDRLGAGAANAYAKAGAAAAKRALRGQAPTGSARAALWLGGGRDGEVLGNCRVGDEILFRLVENRSTGYVWQVRGEAMKSTESRSEQALIWDGGGGLSMSPPATGALSPSATEDVLRVSADRHLDSAGVRQERPELGTPSIDGSADEPDQSWLREVLGSGGLREIVLLAERPGEDTVELDLKAPWDPAADAISTVTVPVRVSPQHELDGLASLQRAAHVARLTA